MRMGNYVLQQLGVCSLFISVFVLSRFTRASQLLSAEEKVALLNLHNVERCAAPNATFMPAMYWDTQLEQIAVQWMDSCSGSHEPSTNYVVGSNMAVGSIGQTAVELAQLWVAEKAQWNYELFSSSNYTQMIFAHSIRLGCAFTTCNNSGAFHLGCVYSPQGNMLQAAYPRQGNFTGTPDAATACSATAQDVSALTPYCSSFCQNGGVCSSFEFCSCSTAFAGPFCEINASDFTVPQVYYFADNCNSRLDCLTTGVCCATFVSWGFGLTCTDTISAPNGWVKDSNGCYLPQCSLPCQNGGSCVDTNLCSCPLGYSGAQCQTAGPPSNTTAPPTTSTTTTSTMTTRTTTTAGTTSTTSASTKTTVPRTTSASTVQAVGLQAFFDLSCASAYGAEIYVVPAPACITLGAGKSQVSVEVKCASYDPNISGGTWSMQLWTGPQCSNGAAINLDGKSMSGDGVHSCSGTSLDNGAASISFQIDCTVGTLDPARITSGAAYTDAAGAGGNTNSAPSSFHANALLSPFAAMSVTVSALLLSSRLYL